MIQVISVGPTAIPFYGEGKTVVLLVETNILQNKLLFAFNIRAQSSRSFPQSSGGLLLSQFGSPDPAKSYQTPADWTGFERETPTPRPSGTTGSCPVRQLCSWETGLQFFQDLSCQVPSM